MILLGANRCGFGTMSMVAIGCTICRGCQLDTCHVGIATQVTTQEEADHKGMKRWVPREYDRAVHNLVNFFSAVGEEVRQPTATLGAMHPGSWLAAATCSCTRRMQTASTWAS